MNRMDIDGYKHYNNLSLVSIFFNMKNSLLNYNEQLYLKDFFQELFLKFFQLNQNFQQTSKPLQNYYQFNPIPNPKNKLLTKLFRQY